MRTLPTALLLLLAVLLLGVGALRANGCCSSARSAPELYAADDGVRDAAPDGELRCAVPQASSCGHGDGSGCCGDGCRCVQCPCADTPVAPAAMLERPFEFPDELLVFVALHLQLFSFEASGRVPDCAARIEAPPERRRRGLRRSERLIPLRD